MADMLRRPASAAGWFTAIAAATLLAGCGNAPEPTGMATRTLAAQPPILNQDEPTDISRRPIERAEDGSIELLGSRVPAGTSTTLTWDASRVFSGISTDTPVLVVNGAEPGPTVCLTAAIHGDELNGIEMVRRVLHDLDAEELTGAVVGIPIVNLQGFRRGSRYLPDRRDLNRYFPGNPTGSSASRIAWSLFDNVIRRCDALVDLHTGSFQRTNLPQLRADLRFQEIEDLTRGFGNMVVLHSEAAEGTLRGAAAAAGIPAVTLEAGEPQRLQTSEVNKGVSGIRNLFASMEMLDRTAIFASREPVYYTSTWVRSNHGGILFSLVRLGQPVSTGDIIGTVTDPITNEQNLIYAPVDGRVLGMALNQVVMPGFATFRIGMSTGPDLTMPVDGSESLAEFAANGGRIPERPKAPEIVSDELPSDNDDEPATEYSE